MKVQVEIWSKHTAELDLGRTDDLDEVIEAVERLPLSDFIDHCGERYDVWQYGTLTDLATGKRRIVSYDAQHPSLARAELPDTFHRRRRQLDIE